MYTTFHLLMRRTHIWREHTVIKDTLAVTLTYIHIQYAYSTLRAHASHLLVLFSDVAFAVGSAEAHLIRKRYAGPARSNHRAHNAPARDATDAHKAPVRTQTTPRIRSGDFRGFGRSADSPAGTSTRRRVPRSAELPHGESHKLVRGRATRM